MSDRPPRTIDDRFALAGLVEATRNGVLIIDTDQRVVVRNSKLLTMFGVSDEQLNARGNDAVDEAIAPHLIGPLPPRLDFSANGGAAVGAVHTLRFADGRCYERFVSEHQDRGNRAGFVIVYSDVSSLAQAEEALARDREFLEKAQEVAHIGSWAIELGGNGYLVWSPEMYRILGVAPGTVKSRTDALTEMVHPDDRDLVWHTRETAFAAGQPYDIEHRVVRPDGAIRWVQTRAEILRDTSGRPARIVGTMQDITERRELEEQLRHSQRIEALGRLAGGVAHDLNNALNVILGYTEVILDETRGNPLITSDMEEIRRATERAASTVRQLLAFSRKQRFSRRLFHLEESIAALGRMFERLLGPSIRVEFIAAPNLPPTYGDPGQVEQAIVNLAINARDAMPDGGRLSFRIDVVQLEDAFVQQHPGLNPGRYLALAISDTGHGMTPEVLGKVFEPFFTTKDVGQGTGLGLSMVYGTMQQIGGCISLRSTAGNGTTFELFFPVAEAGGTSQAARFFDAPPTDVTILVVDDEPAVCELAAGTLRRAGYNVISAGSGREALEIANEDHQIDVLLTDLRMPGLNGGELARALSMTHPEMRVVVMSGFADEVLETVDRRAPIARLDKPFTQAALKEAVRQAVADLRPRLS